MGQSGKIIKKMTLKKKDGAKYTVSSGQIQSTVTYNGETTTTNKTYRVITPNKR